MSNGFLTWSGLEGREIGDSEEGLAHSFEDPEASFSGRRVLGHDHHGLEKAVDGGPEAQKMAKER